MCLHSLEVHKYQYIQYAKMLADCLYLIFVKGKFPLMQPKCHNQWAEVILCCRLVVISAEVYDPI